MPLGGAIRLSSPGCAARPRALGCNPFGVKTLLLPPARRGVAVDLAGGPLDRLHHHRLEARVAPHVLAVAQRRVEDAALAVLPYPGHRVIVVLALDAGLLLVPVLQLLFQLLGLVAVALAGALELGELFLLLDLVGGHAL